MRLHDLIAASAAIAPPAFGYQVIQNPGPKGFGYYGGTADTPDITVQFDARSLFGWTNRGGAEQGLSFVLDTGNGFVSLVAAPGFQVTLNGFDYNVAGAQPWTLKVF